MSQSAAENLAPLTQPDIYGYHDYREFLRDWLAHLKSAHGLSTRKIAKSSSVSESYLSMVLNGTRRLSIEQLDKLATALKLERSEHSYLQWLITVTDADSPEDQLEALKKIQRFRQYQNLNPLEIETYRYLQHWYHVAIRELAQLPDFQLDPKWIQSRLRYKVSLGEIKSAVDFLVEHGFLSSSGEGKVAKPEKLVQCKTGVLKPALTKFHSEMLMLASNSITEVPSEERNISAYTCALPEDQLAAARLILEEARAKIVALSQAHESNSDQVFHFGFLAFPLTKKAGESS
ncbi:MAG: TIGR02147 family protein [Bdellovibrionales bacterium]